MMHKAWCSIEEVPYCFSRSSVKFQRHTALKFIKFDPNWAFPDCNSILNSPMAMKWCTKLEVALKRCPIVLQGHSSNFMVTRAEKLIWIQFEITRPVAAIKSLRFALFANKDPKTNFDDWMILQKHVLSFKCNDFFKMANLKAISSSATLIHWLTYIPSFVIITKF